MPFQKTLFWIVVLVILCLSQIQAAPLSVRVDPNKGAPRILLNGKPVRARIFYGQPAPGAIELSNNAEQISFDFTPEGSAQAAATMHMRFGNTAGDIYLDDIKITDLTTGQDVTPVKDFEKGYDSFSSEWNVWPPKPQNTTGSLNVEPGVGANGSSGLHVKLTAPPDGVWPDFHIYLHDNLTLLASHRYRVSLWARATPDRNLTVAFYLPGTVYSYLGGPPGHYESQVKLAAAAGVNFVSTSPPMPWPAPGEKEDYTVTDSVIEATLRANPDALIIPRIGLYAPEWWLKAHPYDLMQWEDGTHGIGWASPASTAFQKDASERLFAWIKHLEAKYGDHIAGYHPVGQNTGEWFYMDSWNRPLNGYAHCDRIAFRKWLRNKYKKIEALRKAWNNNSLEFDLCDVPSVEARHASPDGIFRDPVKERPIIDFVEFQQDSMADSVCGFASIVRKATAGTKLVLFFYGYNFEFSPVSTGPGSSGHYAMRKVLNSPDIDILCSPISYSDRGLGQSAPCMTTAESVALANKMWLNEDDTRTHLTKESLFPGSEHILTSLEQTNNELVRNTGQESLRNFATWWMDLGATGWFDHPGIWAKMKQLGNIDYPMLQKPRPFRPEIAVVLDEKSMLRMADGANVVGTPAIYEARTALGRMGTPYGQYLLDDVARGLVKAKLYIFVNAWKLDTKTRAALLKATKGATCVWAYAPGYFDNYQKSLAAMKQLTGFDLQPVSNIKAIATPVVKGIGDKLGVDREIKPLFHAVDAKPSEVLATYSNGSAAIAVRKLKTGTSVFLGAPQYNSDFLRFIARKAGVHVYADRDCNIWANGPFLSLHAAKTGPVEINTGRKAPVTDVLTGKPVAKGPVFTLNLEFAESMILNIGEPTAK